METPSPNHGPTPSAKSPGRIIAAIGILALGGLLVGGIMPRMKQEKTLSEDSADVNSSVKEVNVVPPHLAKSEGLSLPGSIRALEETQIYARTSGYLIKRYVDIGSHVKQGDLLAEISSPDVDQQQFQAIADQAKATATVGQSRADVQNKQATVEEMRAEAAKSTAGIEQAKAAVASSNSKLAQAKANLSSSIAKVAQAKQALETQNASLKQAQAQHDLAETTAKRYRSLLAQGFVAQQDADQAEANVKTTSASVDSAKAQIGAAKAQVDAAVQDVESSKAMVAAAEADVRSSQESVRAARAGLSSSIANISAAQANVGASQANVVASAAQVQSNKANTDRFSVLKNFSRITAPFDGVITLRNADVGSLINPGDASNPKLALFSIARVDTLRIQVSVPQTYFQAVRPGTKASIIVKEMHGKEFPAEVFQNAGAIDPTSRTLLTEVRIPNAQNALIPGMYAQVKFGVGGSVKSLRIPSNTLMVDATGTHVVIVQDGKLKFVPIVISRDFGTEIEIASGLNGDEQVVTNPTDDLKPGQSVKILPAEGGKTK